MYLNKRQALLGFANTVAEYDIGNRRYDFYFSKLITDPIKKLSSTEMEFAQGDFSKRVEIKGNDEVSKLSENFNFMADKIEDNIKELKDAVKRQEDFTGNFAHELKTPLTSIIGYSDMLRSKNSARTSNLFMRIIFLRRASDLRLSLKNLWK